MFGITEKLAGKSQLPNLEDVLPGRKEPLSIESRHFVLGVDFMDNYPSQMETAVFGMGCFWGAERLFWQKADVYATAVGYSGGLTPNPTYEEVCSGKTGHTEAVLVVYDPATTRYQSLLKLFWENHDPTQGMRQGNDMGTQYRSAIYTTSPSQLTEALSSREKFQAELRQLDMAEITTEIKVAGDFYFAETYHQQYLAKNPAGYCGLKGTSACLV